MSEIEGKAVTGSGEQAGTRAIFNGATGVNAVAGEAAREAVEPSWSERDTNHFLRLLLRAGSGSDRSRLPLSLPRLCPMSLNLGPRVAM